MIFKDTYEEVLDGTKTQTRRLVKKGDFEVDWPMTCVFRDTKSGGNRLIWRENQTYAVQPGRGKHAIGRIGIINIRQEQLRSISAEDCIAEGLTSHLREHDAVIDLREQFRMLWDGIHTLKGQRWNDNPEVWVLEFELA